MIGKKFGRLKVISFSHVDEDIRKNKIYECLCNCGSKVLVIEWNLKSGNTNSCGCYRRDKTIAAQTKHNRIKTREYHSWAEMIQRCTNPKNHAYNRYGGRGILICKDWMSFINFYNDMKDCPPNYSLDRINNNEGYYKGNCRWASSQEQNSNKRSNKNITLDNITKNIAMWARELNIPYGTLYCRIYKYNWPIEKALTINEDK